MSKTSVKTTAATTNTLRKLPYSAPLESLPPSFKASFRFGRKACSFQPSSAWAGASVVLKFTAARAFFQLLVHRKVTNAENAARRTPGGSQNDLWKERRAFQSAFSLRRARK
jgi:hypothetical protein